MSIRGVATVWRWECTRLLGLVRVRVLLLATLAGPWLFVTALAVQGQVPRDTLFGEWVHTSGWAVPLVLLGFVGMWLVPLIVAIFASGVFAGEDEAGTWAGLLTRGRNRAEVFAGKCLATFAASAAAIAVAAVSSVLAGLAATGDQPLVGLSGNQVASGRAAGLVFASWATTLAPVLAFTAIALLCSVVTRATIPAVVIPVLVGIVCQVDSLIGTGDPLRHLIVTTPLESWHGLFASPVFLHPLWRGLVVSAVWLAGALGLAGYAFSRREFTSA
jgi:ABC-2 type transport system permease protein